MASLIDSEAEKLKELRKQSESSTGRKRSEAGFGAFKSKYSKVLSNFKEKENTKAPIPSEDQSVEQLRGTISKNIPVVDSTSGINDQKYVLPEVKSTTGTSFETSKEIDSDTSSISDQRYDLPVVDSRTASANESTARNEAIPVVPPTSGISDQRYNIPFDLNDLARDKFGKGITNYEAIDTFSGEADRGLKSDIKEVLISSEEENSNQKVHTSGRIDQRYIQPQVPSNQVSTVENLKLLTDNRSVVESTSGISHHGYENKTSEIPSGPRAEEIQAYLAPEVEYTSGMFSEPKTLTQNLQSENEFLDQSSFVTDEVRNRPKDQLIIRPQNGELHIPHELYQAITVNIRSLHDRDVFSALVRLSLGWHKDWCEAGYGYLAEWTNIKDRSNIAKSLKRLVDRNFIVKIKEPNLRLAKGTTYQIPLVTTYLKRRGTTDKNAFAENLNFDLPQVQSTTGASNHRQMYETPQDSGIKYDTHVVQKTTNKEPIKERDKETLSSYIDKKVPPGRRVRVFNDLSFWIGKFTEAEICEAVEYVTQNGMIGSPTQEQPFDVFSYVSATMEKIRLTIKKAKSLEELKNKQIELAREAEQAEKQLLLEQEEIQMRYFSEAQEAINRFNSQYSDQLDRVEALRLLKKKYYEMNNINSEFNIPDEPVIVLWSKGQL